MDALCGLGYNCAFRWEVDLLGVDSVGVDFVRVDLVGGHLLIHLKCYF